MAIERDSVRNHADEVVFVETSANGHLSNRGFTLIEMLVTLAVSAIGIFAIAALITDVVKIQKRSTTVQMLTQMRTSIVGAVTDGRTSAAVPSAWERTFGDISVSTGTPLMACLANNTACTKDVGSQINLKNIDGTEFFHSLNPTRGFNFDGILCNSFSLLAPDPACPLRWDLTWVPRCVGNTKTVCENPVIEIEGRLEYSPTNGDPFNGVLNVEQFMVRLRRGDKADRNEPVVLAYIENDDTGETGSCFNTWTPRAVNTIISDPGNNATIVSATSFSLTAGNYECRIQAPGFKNGGNKLNLVGAGVNILSGVTSASLQGESVNVTMQANFYISGTTTLQVNHFCTQQPSNASFGVVLNDWILGVPVPDGALAPGTEYTSTVYTVVSCVKTSG